MSERIWDRFLTDQDRAHVERFPPASAGFGRRPALVLIDLFRGAFGDEPQPLLEAAELWPATCGLAGWHALPHIQELLGAARTAGLPVIHVTATAPAGDAPEANVRPSKLRATGGGQEAPRETPDPGAADRWRRRFDLLDEVAPLAGERVVIKPAASAFWKTELEKELQDRDIDTLLVAGQSTSGCVRASVFDGCIRGLHMVVVEECVFDRHEASHAINLFDMNQKYADVVPLREVLQMLQHLPAPR